MPRSAPGFWRHRGVAAMALLPLSLVFSLVADARRQLYRFGLLRIERLPVPVVVVGNIAVGGSGKTPVALWLAAELRSRGRVPGIVSRGYGGRVEGVAEVVPGADPGHFGDEPALMAALSGCPVFVGRDRPAAARALLQSHPRLAVLIADDGLQHYRLGRDVEVVVVDDGSTDNTEAVVRRLVGGVPDVTLVYLKTEHGGCARARALPRAPPGRDGSC